MECKQISNAEIKNISQSKGWKTEEEKNKTGEQDRKLNKSI
jgi:hypothetical protein